jgi:hypothetical protein
MRFLSRSRRPLGRTASNFHSLLSIYARRMYQSFRVIRAELQKFILHAPWHGAWGNCPMRFLSRSPQPLGQMLPNFHSVILTYARKFY